MPQFIRNLRLSRKFFLLSAVAAGVVALPLAYSVRSVERDLARDRSELAGIGPSRGLLRVVQLTQQHRGLSASALAGKTEFESQRSVRQAETEQAVDALDTQLKSLGESSRLRADWESVVGEWRALAKDVAGRSVSAPQSFERHTAMIAHALELHDRVLDVSGLILESDPGAYFLAVSALQKAPALAELLAQLRGLGALALTRQEVTADQKAGLRLVGDLTQIQLREVALNLEKVFDVAPAAKARLADSLARVQAATAMAQKLTQERIVDAPALTLASTEYFKAMSESIDQVYGLQQQASEVLEARLAANMQEIRRLEWLLLGSCLLLSALGLVLGRTVTRSISDAVESARASAVRIAAGDLSNAPPATSSDELGELMTAMAAMQASLIRVVGSVRQNADSVATASVQIAQGNLDLSARTEQQASALEETAATMEQLNTTVSNNAESSQQANALAQNATSIAVRGGEMVGQVVEKMDGIRRSVAQDRRDHRRDRRHRLPDQHPGAERRGGSRAGWRAGPRLCGGGGRGALAGPAVGGCSAGNQDPDQRQRRAGSSKGPRWSARPAARSTRWSRPSSVSARSSPRSAWPVPSRVSVCSRSGRPSARWTR